MGMHVVRYYVVGCGISVWVETSNERKEGSLPSIGCVDLLSYAQSMATKLSTGRSVSCTSIDVTSGVFVFIKASAALATLASSRTGRYPPAANCIVPVLARVAKVVATNIVDLATVFAAVVLVVCPLVSTGSLHGYKRRRIDAV